MEEEGPAAGFAFVSAELTGRFGSVVASAVRPLAATSWSQMSAIGGAYSCALPGQSQARARLARPFEDRLFFAGEATHPHDFLHALLVVDCLRLDNPLVDPGLFRICPFTGADLIMTPYSVAFGAMLLSIALWLQEGWGWSGLKAGLTIATGPFLMPVTSLLIAAA